MESFAFRELPYVHCAWDDLRFSTRSSEIKRLRRTVRLDHYLAGRKSCGRFAHSVLDNFIKPETQRPTAEVLMEMGLVMREVQTPFPRKPPRGELRFFCPPRRDSLSLPSLGSRRCARSAGCVSCFSLSLSLCVEKLNKNNDIMIRRGTARVAITHLDWLSYSRVNTTSPLRYDKASLGVLEDISYISIYQGYPGPSSKLRSFR